MNNDVTDSSAAGGCRSSPLLPTLESHAGRLPPLHVAAAPLADPIHEAVRALLRVDKDDAHSSRLISSPSALLRVDGRLAVLGTLWSVGWFVVILTMLLRSQRQAPTGTEALVGARGVVRSVLNPGGIVAVNDAVWRAELAGGGLLPTGQRIRVDAVKNGILQVNAEDPAAVRPAKRRMRTPRTVPRA